MRIRTAVEDAPTHAAMTTGIGWARSSNPSEKQSELLSCSDDQTIRKWDIDGKYLGKLWDAPSACTGLDIVQLSKKQDTLVF